MELRWKAARGTESAGRRPRRARLIGQRQGKLARSRGHATINTGARGMGSSGYELPTSIRSVYNCRASVEMMFPAHVSHRRLGRGAATTQMSRPITGARRHRETAGATGLFTSPGDDRGLVVSATPATSRVITRYRRARAGRTESRPRRREDAGAVSGVDALAAHSGDIHRSRGVRRVAGAAAIRVAIRRTSPRLSVMLDSFALR